MKMRRLLIHLAVGLALLSGSTVLADELVHFSFNKIEFPYQTVEVRKADGSTSSAEFASEIILLSDGRGNGGFGIWERGTPDTLSLFRVVSGSISVERRTGPFFEFKAQRLTPLPANEITVRFDPSPGNTPTGTVTFFIDGIPSADGSPLRVIAKGNVQSGRVLAGQVDASFDFNYLNAPLQTLLVETISGNYTANFQNAALIFPSGHAIGVLALSGPDGAPRSLRIVGGEIQTPQAGAVAALLKSTNPATPPARPLPVLMVIADMQGSEPCRIYDILGTQFPPAHFEANAYNSRLTIASR